MKAVPRKADKLVAFLYILLRDHVQPGAIERLIDDHIDGQNEPVSVYSNPHVLSYAEDIAARLRGENVD